MYEITSFWPNSRAEPRIDHSDRFLSAFMLAAQLMASRQHTTISVRIDTLELVRLWGQPPPDGGEWP